MKGDKICSCAIHIDMFYSEVIVLITNSKDYLYNEVESVLSDDLGMKKEYAKDFAPEIQKYLDEEKVLPPDMTLNIESSTGGKDVFVIFDGTPKTVINEVIIHEMVHAMQCICDTRGIDDGETEAYMVEYLCHVLFTQIAEWNKGTKKG